MAARINTRFILILVVVVGILGGGALGLSLFVFKKSADEFIQQADELVAAGRLDNALLQYERAIEQDPTNLEALDKLMSTLDSIVPESQSEIFSRLLRKLQTYQHYAVHFPSDAARHEDYIAALWETSVVRPIYWEENMLTAATAMQTAGTGPEFAVADFYRGMALAYPGFQSLATRTDTELEEGRALVRAYVEANPDDDMARGILIGMLQGEEEELRNGNETRRADAVAEELDAVVSAVIDDADAGLESLLHAIDVQRRRFGAAVNAQANALPANRAAAEEAFALEKDNLIQLSERFLARITESAGSSEPDRHRRRMIWQSTRLLTNVMAVSRDLSPAPALEAWLATEDGANDVLSYRTLARAKQAESELTGDLDEKLALLDAADAAAQAELDVPPLTVDVLCIVQRDTPVSGLWIQQQNAFTRWGLRALPDEQREAAKERVVALAGEVETALDELGLEADQIARGLASKAYRRFVEDRQRDAAPLLTRLLDEHADELPPGERSLYRYMNALCLLREGATGEAATQLRLALLDRPREVRLIEAYADALVANGEPNAAAVQLGLLRQINAPADAIDRVARRIDLAAGTRTSDLALAAIRRAGTERRAGRIEDAIALLQDATIEFPDDARVYATLADYLDFSGDKEQARAAIDRALALAPASAIFQRLRTRIFAEDPIDAIEGPLNEAIEDPTLRAVLIAIAIDRQLERRRAERAVTQDADRAAVLDAEIARFEAEARVRTEDVRARLVEAPNREALIEWRNFELGKLVAAGSWEEAEAVTEQIAAEDLDRANGAFARGILAQARGAAATDVEERRGLLQEAVSQLTAATDRLPFSARAWSGLGNAYRLLGNNEEAVAALAEAVENDPQDRALVIAYMDLLERTGNRERAAQVAQAAAQRLPDDRVLREVWLEIETRLGRVGPVLLIRRGIYQDDPRDRENAIKYALALATVTPEYQLLLNDDGSPKHSRPRWDSYRPDQRRTFLNAERELWITEAERVAAELRPTDLATVGGTAWATMRAEIYRAQGRPELGAQTLLEAYDAVDDEGERLAMLAVASQYLENVNRPADALELLRGAAAWMPENRIDHIWGETQLLARLNRFADAEASARQVLDMLREGPKATLAANLRLLNVINITVTEAMGERHLIEVLLRAGRIADARAALDARQAADEGPSDGLIRAAVMIREADELRVAGRPEDADAIDDDVDAVLAELGQLYPTVPQSFALRVDRMVARAERTGNSNILDRAEDVVTEGLRGAPGTRTLVSARLQVLAARDDRASMIATIDEWLDNAPGDDDLRLRQVQLQLTEDRPADAAATVQDAISFYGSKQESLIWRNRLGQIYEELGQPMEAANAFLTAWNETGRNRPEFLVGYTRSLLALPEPEFARIAAILGDSSRAADLDARPALRTIFARALAGLGQSDRAMGEYRVAYERISSLIGQGLVPPSAIGQWVQSLRAAAGPDRMADVENFLRSLSGQAPNAFELASLATAWFQSGATGHARSLELLDEAIAGVSSNPAGQALKGQLYSTRGEMLLQMSQPQAALADLERGLDLLPDNATLLNNIAFLRATVMDDPESAMPLAERAVAIRPNAWSQLDTAGHIAYLLGRYDEAEDYLRRSVRADERSENLFHLAQVMASTDRPDLAMRHLETASELLQGRDPDLQERIDALADEVADALGAGR